MRITLQPAFVLHSRPYRETGVILDLFTRDCGRMAVIARNVRQSRSPIRSLLQPFIPLLVTWQGKTELVTLLTAESSDHSRRLSGDGLLSGLYLNELLMRILHKHDPHPGLYTIYHETLLELQNPELRLKTLRLFEKKLLDEIGYGLPLTQGATFVADKYYRFHPEHGFTLCAADGASEHNVFSGKSLLAFADENLAAETALQDAKRLMRQALAPLLGQQKLNSRLLYLPPREIQIDEVSTE